MTGFLILQKFVSIQLCSCVIYSKLAVLVVLASIKHLEPCKSYFKSQNKIGFNRYILYKLYRFVMFFPTIIDPFKSFYAVLKTRIGVWALRALQDPCFESNMSLKQTQEKINRFTICSRQTHTHSQLQPTMINNEKGRSFVPLARLFKPEEIIFQFAVENKVIFHNSFWRRPEI